MAPDERNNVIVAERVAGAARLVVVRGVVDRDDARGIDSLIRYGTSDPPASLVIDISRVGEVNGR